MLVIAACILLVAVGVVLVVRWGGRSGPGPAGAGGAGWIRQGAAALAAGAVAGVLAAGAGGRLVMRLLALTSPDAEGSLVLAATRIDPLRDENIDFALLGPGWLAVLAFVAVGVFHGMVVAAVAARLAPTPAISRRALVAGRVAVAGIALVALPGFAGSAADIVTS